MRCSIVGIFATGFLNLMGCSGSKAASAGTTAGGGASSASGSSSIGSTGNGSSTTGSGSPGSSSGGFGEGPDPDGGIEYSDGGFPSLSCTPPMGFQGNSMGVGAYCDNS